MLEELDEDVDTTHSRLRATQKKARGPRAPQPGLGASAAGWRAAPASLRSGALELRAARAQTASARTGLCKQSRETQCCLKDLVCLTDLAPASGTFPPLPPPPDHGRDPEERH
jgi:hypothetical protein